MQCQRNTDASASTSVTIQLCCQSAVDRDSMQLVTDPAAAVSHGLLVHGHDRLLSLNLQYEQVASDAHM